MWWDTVSDFWSTKYNFFFDYDAQNALFALSENASRMRPSITLDQNLKKNQRLIYSLADMVKSSMSEYTVTLTLLVKFAIGRKTIVGLRLAKFYEVKFLARPSLLGENCRYWNIWNSLSYHNVKIISLSFLYRYARTETQ